MKNKQMKKKANTPEAQESLDQMVKGIMDQIVLAFISLKHLRERLDKVKETSDAQLWMNRREVSQYLGVSVSTLSQWATQKRGIPFTKKGKIVRYRVEDVKNFMK